MRSIEKNIKEILEEKKRPLSWLAAELGYSRQGLKNGLANKTIKFETLENISTALETPLANIIDSSVSNYNDSEEGKVIQSLEEKNKELKEKISLFKLRLETSEERVEVYKTKLQIKKHGFDYLFDFVMKLQGLNEEDLTNDRDKLRVISDPIKTPELYLSSIRYIFGRD